MERKIRLRGGLKSPIVTEIKRGGTVTVLEQYDNWARVMTPDGHIGYMHKWKMKNLHEETLKSDLLLRSTRIFHWIRRL